MKTKIFTLFVALLATTALWAYDFQSGDLYYNITSSSAPYTVEVTYQQNESASTYEGFISIPETVTYENIIYNVTSIGSQAFSNCIAPISITIPNSVTTIKDYAFIGCYFLTSITIPNSVTSIGIFAFSYCSSLTSVTLPNSITCIGEQAFSSCSSLSSVTIPNSVTSIGEYAFYNCSSLTSVTIGNSVTSIGGFAFSYCSSLTSITIPNSVTSIGDFSFSYCSALTSVTIPNSVTSIGEYAFGYCSALKEVICKAKIVPETGREVFYDCPTNTAILYVPEYTIETYRTTNPWSEFGMILPLEQTPSSVEDIHSPSSMTNSQKIIRNGQLLILKDGKTYNVVGQIVE